MPPALPATTPAAVPARSGAARRLLSPAVLVALSPLVAVVVALSIGGIFIAAIGQNPFEIYALMLRESFGTGYGLGQTLFRATPLVFTGLAVAVGFRAGLFNIGVEGQLYLGGFAASMVGCTLAGLPAVVLLPLAILAAAAAGAVWGAIPGVLKARFGSHEVINTIMMNFIAFALVAYFGRFAYQTSTVRTAEVGAGAVIPRLGEWLPALFAPLKGTPANLSLFIALATALAAGVLLFRTRRGYELRAVGLNAPAAEYGGISIGRSHALAMALSGAIAGVGGINFVLGYKHYFEQGFSAGAGFLGIAVALIGRNHPAGVIVAALFFGALSYAGLVINERVPRELVEMLQGLVILSAIAAQQVLERAARRMR
jgi:general nucleoside transport system permease protein